MNVEQQKFGKLSVIQEIERPAGKNYGRHWVKCKCDCGSTFVVALEKLKGKQVTSCGCQKHYKGADSPYWKGCGEISRDFYSTYRRNAKTTSKVFSVSIEYLWKLFLKQNRKCALSGLDLSFDYQGNRLENKHKQTNKITASIDRKDSSQGYVEGNVQWVHKRINIMKNDLTDKQFIEYCRIVSENNP